MIITMGEYIRKNDTNLAIMVVMLMRMNEIKEMGNIEDIEKIYETYKNDILWMISRLKMPVDTSNPFSWMN